MDLLNILKYYCWNIPDRFCHRLNITIFKKTKYGIKNLNAGCLTTYAHADVSDTISLSAEVLFLGPDFLKDKYTLIDRPLLESPHFMLVKTEIEKGNVAETDYYKRLIKGTLDWRYCFLKHKQLSGYYTKNEAMIERINSNDYKPAIVYKWKGHYYLFDGKHRAALCAALGKPIKCVVISPFIALDGVWNKLFIIASKSKGFNKHVEFIKD